MINVRLMTEEDLDQVAILEKNTFSIPWSKKSFADALYFSGSLFAVAEENEKIIGYGGMYISFNDGDITNVAVDESARRKGIGSTIIEYLLAQAKKRNVTDVALEVRETNAAAITLYEKYGFERTSIRKDYYKKPTENALIMWKHNL